MENKRRHRRKHFNILDKFRKIKVDARDGEDIKYLLRRFNKLCDKLGIMKEVKRHSEYEKPSEKRKREKRKRLKNIKKMESLQYGRKKPKKQTYTNSKNPK